ncbi:hypothetical protein BIU97_04370 [Curtobacterium sp. MCBA15_009]|uniref:hypothetical protein n=1 Tax=Curtobacterium sp. MCBA15_009 TaxID=1898737 RepID=UPI0008DCC012|nr:hypothetical protein [Curtobacterium sp. MCBA15_009]OII12228.1 hypothetical protein BIU97_04370 [Curtobacterium sp. MCBA15_009]
MTAHVVGGPGWVIRADDLRPEITDLRAFRLGLTGDPLAEPLELLWSGGAAAAIDLLDGHEPSRRVRALRADCLRDLGETDAAVAEYDALVSECVGTGHEAVMRQHRGKALLAAGRADRAVDDFRRVVELRLDGDPDLLASARLALAVALSRERTPD